jgi:hypothetical protein
MANNVATAETNKGMQAVIGLTGFASQQGDFRVYKERLTRIELPGNFTADHIELMKKDLAAIIKIAEQQPQDFLSLNNAVLQYDLQAANQLAGKIGLTEENLRANGGDVWGVVAAIAIAAAILLASDSPTPPPEPSQPGSDAGSG